MSCRSETNVLDPNNDIEMDFNCKPATSGKDGKFRYGRLGTIAGAGKSLMQWFKGDGSGDLTAELNMSNGNLDLEGVLTAKNIINQGTETISSSTSTLSSGAITPTTSVVKVTSESGFTDDLTSVLMGQGRFVLLRASALHTITVKDGSTMHLAGGADMVLTGEDTLYLYPFSSNIFTEISRSNN